MIGQRAARDVGHRSVDALTTPKAKTGTMGGDSVRRRLPQPGTADADGINRPGQQHLQRAAMPRDLAAS